MMIVRTFTFHYASTISILRQQKSMESLALHSTMLLLYPVYTVFRESENHFTFHYASTISPVRQAVEVRHSVFTFHYASTISTSANSSQTAEQNFTFHYASTISGKRWKIHSYLTSLHSTMLLLYPLKYGYNEKENILYIPLCFYYIWNRSGKDSISYPFTFHYASTISPRLCTRQ